MSSLILLVTVIGFYFMLAPEDAYKRFNVSFRVQTKFIIGMFVLFAMQNIILIAAGLQVGVAFPIARLLFLGLDVWLIKTYFVKL